jgi:transcriptional regulator of acetoin/glycerol metabolism
MPDGSASVTDNSPVATTVESLDKVVAGHLARALAATHGRIDGPRGAASLLGLNPSTLRAKLRKHNIDSTGYRVR